MNDQKRNRKPLNTAKAISRYMADYYYHLDHAAKTGEQKVAWCTSVGPAEILRAMGFAVYFPETHSAMLGAVKTATDYIPQATALGYSPEVCSYMTADIGAFLQGETPLSRAYPGIDSIPRPDVLVFNTNQCRDVQDWFAWYARYFNVPKLGVNGNVGVETVDETLVTAVAAQMENLVDQLEKITGESLRLENLEATIAHSRKCSDLWEMVLQEAAATPSPLTFFDGCTLMGPAVVGRGTEAAVILYQDLLAELKNRTATGEGAIDQERIRIYWDGMPVWGRLGAHSKLFADLNSNVLASTYCSSWVFSALDAADPFRSMARAYTELFIVRSDEYKERYIREKTEFYQVDGIIYHDAKTCPNNSNCRYGLSNRIEAQTGIPTLVINGDLNDLRCISDEQTRTNIEAFVEQLEEQGSSRKDIPV